MPELSARRKRLVLGICCMSLLIVGMDNTIVNVALPSIRTEFSASIPGLQWTIDAYTVTLASLLVLAGSTADRLGRRRIFQIGLALFSVGSLLCSIAPSLSWLIVFRMVQAVGGSMLNPVAMSIITNVFTERSERAKAIGVWGGVVGISLGLGPLVGGLLTESVGWRSIFWINVPIGVAAIVLCTLFVPESRAARPRRPDPVGQVLVIVLLAAVTYAIIESPRSGIASAELLTVIALAITAGIVLVVVENRRAEPLIDPRFFSSAPFSGATLIAVLAFGSFAGFLFLNTLYLQNVRGLTALEAGVTTVPMALATLILAPLSGRLVARFGPRPSLLGAGSFMLAAAIGLLGMTASTPFGWLILCYLVFGVGFGLVNAPITNTAVSGMPTSQAGVAAAVASTSRQVGASLGVAVVGAMISAAGYDPKDPARLLNAAPVVWSTVAACSVGVLLLSALTTGPWARRTAESTARRLGDGTGLPAPEPSR